MVPLFGEVGDVVEEMGEMKFCTSRAILLAAMWASC